MRNLISKKKTFWIIGILISPIFFDLLNHTTVMIFNMGTYFGTVFRFIFEKIVS